MSGVENFAGMDKHALRGELEELYAEYVGCLNDERFEEWPDFFIEQCLYKIVPRENFERGLPLATWLSESKGYLRDRITGIRRTSVYGPRYIRRSVSAIRILGWKNGLLDARASYAALETLPDQLTRLFNVGEYHDRIAVEAGRLKFAQKICVFDSVLVPNSLIYPL